MERLIQALQVITSHISKYISNYLLLIGLVFVYRYIFIKYGIDIFLLALGVFLIFVAFVIELSSKKNKKNRY